jgi:DNA-binding CsgD family transcriptional regulator
VKRVRVFAKPAPQEKKTRLNQMHAPSRFVFCEKSTGMTRFEAESDAGPDSTVERMAGLLAIQCLVRGHDPGDFVVLVPADQALCDRLVSRAAALLEEGRSVVNPGCLSPRQREILHSVVRHRANKEIASRLNITVRTVKFHISALLEKFGVENRSELARRAAGVLQQEVSGQETPETQAPVAVRGSRTAPALNLGYVLPATMKGHTVRFQEALLTA